MIPTPIVDVKKALGAKCSNANVEAKLQTLLDSIDSTDLRVLADHSQIVIRRGTLCVMLFEEK